MVLEQLHREATRPGPDHGANRYAAETPEGEPDMSIVPGATWLAMMALPYFPVVAMAAKVRTRGVDLDSRRNRTLVMPCWRAPLDSSAIEVILDHPLLGLDKETGGARGTRAKLQALGVHAVLASRVVRRRVASQSEYYLGKAELLPGRNR
ncbi:MAG: type I-G CRISPR-associated protein, Cas3-extension family [Actinomycetota bacterium]